jgi:protoporphyrinogen oxidase
MDDIVIVGGGPSGLAAAHEAARRGARVTVLEKFDRVGGLARTMDFEGNRFDIGPHRFFTKNQEMHALFVDTIGEDLVNVKRLTRIFYNNKYFDYPLTPLNALFGVGITSTAAIFSSYLAARLRRVAGTLDMQSFEDWVVDRFGYRLYETFFKTYTEKVWGIPCTEIGADWAAQRIKGLSLTSAIANAIFKPKQKTIKTLIEEFVYPRRGAGQLYEKMATIVSGMGSGVRLGARVRAIRRDDMRVRSVCFDSDDGSTDVDARFFLVSAPLTELVEMMEPAAPPEVLAACRRLRYRNHLGVNLLVDGSPFPDNWIYIHSKDVGMARICNYANFSPAMAAREGLSPLTVEYFTFPGDGTWEAPDEVLRERVLRELEHMKILKRDQVLNCFVVRSDKAYPVIEIGYERHIATIKTWLDGFENLLPIGRSGMFKYNNQDHAMYTGVLAARTALGISKFDPWLVNIDAEYHEGARSGQ